MSGTSTGYLIFYSLYFFYEKEKVYKFVKVKSFIFSEMIIAIQGKRTEFTISKTLSINANSVN